MITITMHLSQCFIYFLFLTLITNNNVSLASLVQAKRNDMRIQHRRIERRNEKIQVRQHDSHGTIDDTIVAIHETFWLVSVPSGYIAGIGRNGEGAVCQIELLAPPDPLRRAGCSGSDIAVVGSDGLTRAVPAEEDFLAGEREWLGFVVSDRG